MQKIEWMYYLKLSLHCICPAAPVRLLLYVVFKQEAEGAAPRWVRVSGTEEEGSGNSDPSSKPGIKLSGTAVPCHWQGTGNLR